MPNSNEVPNAAPEFGVTCDLDVAGCARELPSADKRVAEEAHIERIDQRRDDEGDKQQEERRQEQIGRELS